MLLVRRLQLIELWPYPEETREERKKENQVPSIKFPTSAPWSYKYLYILNFIYSSICISSTTVTGTAPEHNSIAYVQTNYSTTEQGVLAGYEVIHSNVRIFW